MGLKLLPNVRDFQIKVGNTDELFASIGLKINNKAALKFEPYTNRHINRWVVRQYLRLEANRGDGVKFWRIARSLMKSTAYQLIMANKSALEG